MPAEGLTPRRGSGDRRLLIKTARWLRPYRGQVILTLVALAAAAASELSLGFAVRGIVDGLLDSAGASLRPFLWWLAGIGFIYTLANYFRVYLVNWLAERAIADVRIDLFHHVVGLSPRFFETTKTAEIISRLVVDTSLLQSLLMATVPSILHGLILAGGSAVLMGVTSWKLSIVVLVLLPLFALPSRKMGLKLRALSAAAQDRLAKVGAAANESLRAVSTVQAFNHEETESRRVAQGVEDAFHAARRRFAGEALLASTMVLVGFCLLALVVWIGTREVAAGRMTPGELTAFLLYALIAAGSFARLSGAWAQTQRAAGAMERVLELMQVEPLIQVPAEPLSLPEPCRGSIVFQEVTFRYPSRPATPALDSFSLEVSPGETLALVGPSGAGKSTVFNLLMRFHDIESGHIFFDGVDIAMVSPHELRRRIAVVAQEPDLFSTTVSENILYGFPEASAEEAIAAAEAASAREFIDRLPSGFDTDLGEQGVRLSGGQRQRLAIARAMIRRSAGVLLFDEATSALDSESERRIQQAMAKVAGEKTLIVIAHRLATVRMADRIVVMDKGKIVGVGKHEDLLHTSALYSRLAGQQFGMVAAGEHRPQFFRRRWGRSDAHPLHDPEEWDMDLPGH